MTDVEIVNAYLKEIARQFATGAATEHSYRPALQRMLADAIPRATVVNEPARIECGAPDFLVRDHLVPRLNGFEILMASYAMAHLKLDLLLPGATERLRIFLTNSLEEFSEATGTLWAMELSNESREADFIKRDCPVMVVMGNPPYSVSSSNKGEWIQRLVADYRKGLGEKKINLDDDYIKFIRLGQHYIDRNGEGILAYISNNSFLDGITHRQMRKSLMESFDEIYILDLHGNARKKETAPDGGKDENVFDIMQGVSINIFVKRGTGNSRVFHAEVFGLREAKYAFLDAHDLTSVDYKELHPQAPYYFFVPKDFALQEEYEKGFSVAELMPVNGLGVKTERDSVTIHLSRGSLRATVSDFSFLDVETLRLKYNLGKDSRDWSIDRAKADVISHSDFERYSKQITVRPFDSRWIFYPGTSKGFIGTPAFPIMQHMLLDNVAICLIRNSRGHEALLPFVAEGLVGKDTVSSLDNCRVFPLYLYSDNLGKVEKTPNLNPEIVGKIADVIDRDAALAYYRRFELGRTWYDIVPVEEISSLVPIPVTPDPTADRRKVKEIFRAMPPVKNLHDGRVVTFPVHGAKKLALREEFNILTVAYEFAKLFASSIRIWSENAGGIPNHKEHPEIEAYHQYVTKMQIDGGVYFVRFTVRENKNGASRNELHGTTVTNVLVYKTESAEPTLRTHTHGEDSASPNRGEGLSNPASKRVEDSATSDAGIVPFLCDAVKGDNSADANNAELSLRTHAHGEGSASLLKGEKSSLLRRSQGEDSATFDGAMIPFPFDTVKGDGKGPFVDYKMALFLSYARYGEGTKGTPTPEEIFHYTYAVLHTPSYRERYKEFLKVDFPRIPYPKSGEEFRRLASIGERLVAVHLLKAPKVRDMFSPCATFPVAGSNMVEKCVATVPSPSGAQVDGGGAVATQTLRVFINSTQYFDNVPVEAWESFVGGYQPAQKWLKDRKGRVLSSNDVLHYKSIIAALVESRRLMDELSKISERTAK